MLDAKTLTDIELAAAESAAQSVLDGHPVHGDELDAADAAVRAYRKEREARFSAILRKLTGGAA